MNPINGHLRGPRLFSELSPLKEKVSWKVVFLIPALNMHSLYFMIEFSFGYALIYKASRPTCRVGETIHIIFRREICSERGYCVLCLQCYHQVPGPRDHAMISASPVSPW